MTPDLFNYQPPERYPDVPGFKARETSEQAAEDMATRAPTLRSQCLEWIRRYSDGLTADECAEIMGKTVLSIRPRFSELSAKGQIYETEETRKNDSGKKAIVWKAFKQ